MTTEPTGAIDMHNYEQNAHLPECWATDQIDRAEPLCICDRLRACEARVREESFTEGAIAGVTEMAAVRPARTLAEYREANKFINGYAAALDAARNAVAALGKRHPKWDLMSTHYEGCWKHHSECALTMALAVIDALRGES